MGMLIGFRARLGPDTSAQLEWFYATHRERVVMLRNAFKAECIQTPNGPKVIAAIADMPWFDLFARIKEVLIDYRIHGPRNN